MSKPIFLHYDRQALDREYDNRAKVADSAERLAGYARASADARDALECVLDVPYGPAAGETLDLFPAGPGAPVHVFVHGGYWRALDKADFSYVAGPLVAAGALTAVINYALMPAVTMDELVRQCRASIAWLWHNVERFGGDRERIHVSGHSAGGHLVAMMMATDWPAFDAALPRDLVRGGVGISGLYDLEPIRLCFLNDELSMDEATCARNSPVLLARRCVGPLVLPFGADEGPEYRRQSEALAAAWGAGAEPPRATALAGHDHFSVVEELADADSALTETLVDQMGLG